MTAKIKKGGSRGSLFKELGKGHLLDPDVLYRGKRFHSSIYHAGFAVECVLKWAVTRNQEALYLPAELEHHKIDDLIGAAGLRPGILGSPRIRRAYSAFVDQWGTHIRYSTSSFSDQEATRLYKEIREVYEWVIENTAGK